MTSDFCSYCFNARTVQAYDDEVPCPICRPYKAIACGYDPVTLAYEIFEVAYTGEESESA